MLETKLMKKIQYPFLWISILLASIVIVLGYQYYNKPHKQVKAIKPTFHLTSNSLHQLYEEDEEISNNRFLDQVLEVAGVVDDIYFHDKNSVNIMLQTGSEFSGVSCYLERNQLDQAKSVKKGDHITIKGICTGYLVDVVLIKSVIVTVK